MTSSVQEGTTLLLGWGNNDYGQTGITPHYTEDEEAVVLTPTVVEFFNNGRNIAQLACGWNHTVFLLNSGLVYSCGLNDCGQTGHAAQGPIYNPERIDALEAMQITQVSCGESFTVILNNIGQLYSFGDNSKGQLGLGISDSFKHFPRQVKFTLTVHIVQISSGKQHCVCLSSGGIVFCWGANDHGQLGLGTKSNKIDTPQILLALGGLPLYRVIAGGYHSLALTFSGAIFSWGRNCSGQLGTGDAEDRSEPVKIKLLSEKSVHQIACGEEHTVVLTMAGGVFTFGCGKSGQLGHNNFNNENNPRMVSELMGSVVTGISCGRKHTIAVVGKTGKLYAFGLNVKGQLGLNSSQKYATPKLIKPKWNPVNNNYISNMNWTQNVIMNNFYFYEDYESLKNELLHTVLKMNNSIQYGGKMFYLQQVMGGGLNSFVILSNTMRSDCSLLHCSLTQPTIKYLNTYIVDSMLQRYHENTDATVRRRIMENLVMAFSSKSVLNASFLKRIEHNKILMNSGSTHGLQLLPMREALSKLCAVEELASKIMKAVESVLLPSIKLNQHTEAESLRLFILLPELPFFDDMSRMKTVLLPYANIILELPIGSKNILAKWWSKLPQTFFERLIESFKKGVVKVLDQKLPERPNEEIFTLHAALRTCMSILEIFNKIYQNTASSLVPINTFYIEGLMKKIDMKADYLNWLQSPSIFSFCQYPFVLDAQTKAFLLQIDAENQMKEAFNTTFFFNIAGMMQGAIDHPINPFLVLNVRRDHIVQDALNEILSHHPSELKKPLKVKFSNEEAEDAGGVKKEFFLLLMRDILDPKYGMFDYYGDSRLMWFSASTFEAPEMFLLIGIICGLAIYNSTIIDLPFPSCLYKKLLKRDEELEDLRELEPNIARNLQYMLDYTEADFEDTFSLNFQVTEVSFGETRNVDLKPNGGNIPVTLENREEYVSAYVHYRLSSSVYNQFQSFSEGFHRVCGGKVLEFFHPHELMEMVIGSQDYDFADLEKVAEYKGEYYRQHPVIDNFWTVFYEFDLTDKTKFLAFLTGSDKVSIQGMRNMKFIIQPFSGGQDENHLPVAHTCFNLLDLPKYDTLEKMRTKFRQAIDNTQGFGLV